MVVKPRLLASVAALASAAAITIGCAGTNEVKCAPAPQLLRASNAKLNPIPAVLRPPGA
jgi:hypothetical protein